MKKFIIIIFGLLLIATIILLSGMAKKPVAEYTMDTSEQVGQSSTETVSGLTEETTGQVQLEEYIPKVIIEAKWGDGSEEFGFLKSPEEGIPLGPRAIAVTKSTIYILDSLNRRVNKYTKNGKFLGSIILEKVKELEIKGRMRKLRKDSKIFEIGPGIFLGSENEELFVDLKGNLYLYISSGWGIGRVMIYDKTGKFIGEINEENMSVNFKSIYIADNHSIYIETEDQAILFKILSNKKVVKSNSNIAPNKKYRYLWKNDRPKIIKVNDKYLGFIKKSRKKPWLGKAISNLNEVYEMIYDDDNLEEGLKVIKWEKK
jgi:hypothetical protein